MLKFSNKPQFDLLKEAKNQEVILEKAEIKKLENSGKQVINLTFKIRDDVEQENKGRVIFDSIWEEKNNPGTFDSKKINALLLVQGESGKYDFDDYDELVQFINGMFMQITVELKPADEYHDEPYNQVKYCSYKPSKVLPKTLGGDTSAKETTNKNYAASDVVPMDDVNSDLPF